MEKLSEEQRAYREKGVEYIFGLLTNDWTFTPLENLSDAELIKLDNALYTAHLIIQHAPKR